MKRLLCRLFAVMALVAGIVTPSAGLAFADPSTDTTVAPVPPIPTVAPVPVPTIGGVQNPVVPVIPTQSIGPPPAPVIPPVPVVNVPAPIPAPPPVPQPAPVVLPPVAPAPVPVVVQQPVPQPAPPPVKAPDPVPQQAPVQQPVSVPAPVVQQPTVAPKPAPQPVPVQSPPPVQVTTQQSRPAPDSTVATPVAPTKTEAPGDVPVVVPSPQLAPSTVAGTVGDVDHPQLPPNGNRQLPPPGGPADTSPVVGSAVVNVPHEVNEPHGRNQLPEVTQQAPAAINQNITNTTIDVPRQLPPPGPANPFPDWGYNRPVEAHPVPLPGHGGQPPGGGSQCEALNCNNGNPGPVVGGCGTPPCNNPGPGGSCSTQPCNSPGPTGGGCGTPPCGPPPPIIPDHPVYNPWQNGNQQLPPPNPDIFVRGDDNGQVVFINNVTQINNTVVNNAPATVFLTNFDTNRVLSFNANYGTPMYLSPGWCGGIGGSWGWSANVNLLGFGASFAGGGAFNVGPGCGYVPPPLPPINPLPIYSPGYQPVYASNYFTPQGCGCVYADNTYLYGNYQQVPIQGVPQQVFVPTSYTPDIVFQQPTEGLPPFMTGDDPVSTSWFAKQPAILWVSIGVVMFGLMGLAYVNREHLVSMLR